MLKCKCFIGFLAPLCLVLLLMASGAFSQPPQSDPSPQGTDESERTDGPQQGQRGYGRDREQVQERMIERFKEVMECSDEEWQVIAPKVLSVYRLSNQSRTGTIRTMMGRTSQGNQSDNRRTRTSTSNQSDESLTKLQELLENENATTSDIKKLVSEVRKAREKSEQELATAQKELRELLTVRQEAILITLGLLD